MRKQRKSPGFTLIELLIVVAIIAILALIAVPNFLEAQTRAKVSRVKADMRSLGTALEAYFVDNNSYTFSNNESQNPWAPAGTGEWAGFKQLTTPIAYVTNIPKDPFGLSIYKRDQPGRWHPGVYGLATGDANTRMPSGPPWYPRGGMPSNCWMLESDGPDNYDDIRYDGLSPTGVPKRTGLFPWSEADLNGRSDAAAIAYMIYDPTNGTVSGGEILRLGGTKPPGALYDFLWANAVK